MPSPERAAYVRELINRHPDGSNAGLARIAYREAPEWFRDLEHARWFIRYYSGSAGKWGREKMSKSNRVGRASKRNGVKPCPPSIEDPWEPHVLKSKRLLVLSDIHVPYHNRKALTAAVKYGQDFGPDAVLLNGDTCDFYAVSRWERDPRKRNIVDEVEQVGEMLDWIRTSFPKANIVWKDGNHDERLTKFIWMKAPELWGLDALRLENLLKLDELGVTHVTEQRPILFGGKKDGGDALPIFHGHELPRGMSNPVNMARGAFLRTGHTMLCGHGHRTSQHTEPNMWHEEVTTWSTGCLCGLTPAYARINKWNHGFATAVMRQPGEWQVDNMRISKKGQVW